MVCAVTGCAGFIASSLVDRLLAQGHRVTGIDNFSTGQRRFLEGALKNPEFRLVKGDLLDPSAVTKALKGSQRVFHLAANADVRFGTEHPLKDFEQNTLATYHVLEAMRLQGIKDIVFSSTGSIYGESKVIPTPEESLLPVQTSLYGASKLAAEGFIEAYVEGFGFRGWIFRFVSILGERYSHGHVFDFYKQLRAHPDELFVLGNGHQKKSYLHIDDCIEAMLTAVEKSQKRINIFNLGTEEFCEVNDSISWITGHLGLAPELTYGGGDRGWVGDNPFIFLDTARIRSLGWKPRFSIRDSVIKTLDYLMQNQWLLEERR